MPMSLRSVAKAFEDALAGFEPRLLSGDDAAAAVEALARVERLAATARARAAARVEECGAHRGRGFHRAADWLAHETGAPAGRAREEIDTVKAAEQMAGTRAALLGGEVSLSEAAEIVKVPEAEGELLGVARGHDHRRLKDRARRRRLELDRDSLAERRRNARGVRVWTDELGMVCGRFALPPEVGVPFVHRLEAEAERAWRAGNRDSTPDQRRADALVTMIEGRGRASRRPDLVVVWDLRDDHCHVPGVGPLDAGTARKVARDAVVTGLLHDGVKVDTIRRYGRSIPKDLELLLHLGDPPGFDGIACVDCGATYAIERDHVNPVANGGETSHENLEPRCPPCHRAKTERDREAGLLGAACTRGP